MLTTIEPDHLDFFHSEEAYFKVFDDFASLVTPDTGYLVVCAEDENAAQAGERAQERGINVVAYGAADKSFTSTVPLAAELEREETTAEGMDTTVKVNLPGISETVRYELQIPGHHMVLNSMGALLAGVLSGGAPAAIAEGLADFSGVRRRFEYRGSVDKQGKPVRVFDDYAHHPTEVAAVLRAARAKVEAEGHGGRVIACFQPHLYSRTMEFDAEFAQALSLADAAVVLDIYGAREQPVEGITSRIITDKMPSDMQVIFEPDFSAAARDVVSLVEPGDVVLTIGAGSVTMVAAEILDELRAS